jgi:hypothetical protein
MRALLLSLPLFVAPVFACAETPPASTTTAKAADGAAVGQPAPDFTLTDLDGKSVQLASLRGKTVVLEWFNPGCPYVVAAYESGPLKALPGQLGGDDLVWLRINSGAPGKQGHGLEANKAAASKWGIQGAILVDEAGTVGKAYHATNTPQMAVIDAAGVLRYAGALDDAPMGRKEGGEPVNYVSKAVSAIRAGEPVRPEQTKPYGCSVKY